MPYIPYMLNMMRELYYAVLRKIEQKGTGKSE